MPDYGHPLSFGTFITPLNSDPDAVVSLAVHAESLGFDLVTFQDHPYQPRFLDTWTLMAWVAARTSRIGIGPNVANLPLRPPAVMARAAASLDLLSGGRFSLGLGAGGFWDAIEAMGGPRRTPGEAVDALSEAVDVIRALWTVGDRTPLRVDGKHYRLAGAKRGPAPAHDIPIWLGAYKPRMLRLIGRKADGWLPSYGYLNNDEIAQANAAIDDAAAEAGRDPRAIRRLLNIGGVLAGEGKGPLAGRPGDVVEALVPLALEQGFDTFILASDDEGFLQLFAEEIIPALRGRVTTERGN